MRYRIRPLLPGQFGLFSLFVLILVAAVIFAVFRLPIPLFAKFAIFLTLWISYRVWETRNPKRVNRVRLALMDALGGFVLLSTFLWAVSIHQGGAFFSSQEVLAVALTLFILTWHHIPKAIKAIQDRIWIDRFRP